DDDEEDEILMRVANRSDRDLCLESGVDIQSQSNPDMVRFMQLTGGYINHLRKNAKEIYSSIESSPEDLKKCTRLAKIIAHLRARPSKSQDENVTREFGARLTSQLVRLAKSLAAVLNRKTLDKEVMKRVRKVALDSCRGNTLRIVRYLHGEE